LTVGAVMRPVADKAKISRSKLAFLIDATAAPICMIAPISSWAAAVSSYAPDGEGLAMFIKAIPYNFYSLLTFVFIIAITLMKFDFGPMKLHEFNAENGDLFTSGTKQAVEEMTVNEKGKVIDLIIPIVILIISCVIGMIYSGGFFSGESFIDAFSNSDASVGLAYGAFVSIIITVVYFLIRRVMSFKDIMESFPEGFKAMVPAIMILTLHGLLRL
jgi:Na+/H+ antiporter NhaC